MPLVELTDVHKTFPAARGGTPVEALAILRRGGSESAEHTVQTLAMYSQDLV